MTRTVLLRHTLPDGSWHYDWLVERTPGEARVAAFRLRVRPDDPACNAFDAERMEDHRRVYLDYEGGVTGGRGSVERVVVGEALRVEDGGDRFEAAVRFGDVERLLRGARGEGGWTFTRAEA